MITADSPLTIETCDHAEVILRKRYIDHEIDATLYASLMEDITRIRRRLMK